MSSILQASIAVSWKSVSDWGLTYPVYDSRLQFCLGGGREEDIYSDLTLQHGCAMSP
jgi:hypothetical protein